MKHKCAWGCKTYNPMCDMCNEESNDPDTGWGGFTDHRVGKHFNNEQEQSDYYKNCRNNGIDPYDVEDE